MFLREIDFNNQIRRDNLDVVTEENASVIIESMLASQAEMESYLRHRYDVANVFIDLSNYDNAATYQPGNVVSYPNRESDVYTCLVEDSTGVAPTNTTNWKKADARNPLIKMYLMDICLYHMHSRINPRNIPIFRVQRRDEAIKWLEMVAKSKITTDLPTLTVPDSDIGKNITYGTTKENQLY